MQEAYQPDGGYIPRVLFADAQNNLKPDISNPARPDQYKYYYTSVDDVSLPRIGRTSPSKFVVFTSEEFERSSGYMSPGEQLRVFTVLPVYIPAMPPTFSPSLP